MLREKAQSESIWQTNKETWAKILQEFTFWYLENPLKINKATEDLAALVRTLRHRYPSNSPNLKLNNELFVIPARVINDDREVPKPYMILKVEFDKQNSIARILIADFKQSHGKNHITAPNIARHSHTRVAEITVENVQDIDLLKQAILNTSFDLVDFYGIVNFLKTEINTFGKVQEIIPNMVIDKFPAIKTDTMQSYLQKTLSGSKSQPKCFFCEPTIQIRLYSQAYSGTPNQVDSVLFAVCEQDFQQKSFDKNSPGLLGTDLEMETNPNKINFFETVKRLVNDLEITTFEFGYSLEKLFSQSGINSTRLKI